MDRKYKPNEFVKLVNVSVNTFQRWDREGILTAFRTSTNRRYYTHAQYAEYAGADSNESTKRKVVLYTRVSNVGQKNELKNQVEFLQQFVNAKGMIVDAIIEDIGSGLNCNRKK